MTKIWVSIGKKLTQYKDVVNLCYVFDFLYDFFVDVISEMGYKEVIELCSITRIELLTIIIKYTF